jgi:transcriptional regulator with XRE-family HTH domain
MTPRKNILTEFNETQQYLGKALRCIRELNGLDADALAKNIKCSKNYVYEVEGGKKLPSLDFIKKITDEFGIEVEHFYELALVLKKNEGDKHFLTNALIKGLNMVDTNDHNKKLSSAANPAPKSNTIG